MGTLLVSMRDECQKHTSILRKLKLNIMIQNIEKVTVTVFPV